MARKYVCDRCKKESLSWDTTYIELPAHSYLGNAITGDLCKDCLGALRELIRSFLH